MGHRQQGASLLVGIALLAAACGSQDAGPEAAPTTTQPPAEEQTTTAPPATATPPPEETAPQSVEAFAVTAGDADAVAAGLSVLESGGNAADAAVATAFAVSVVEPFASGMGGGGAAIVAAPGEDPEAFDYREVVAADGRIPASNTGIPGFVAGMAELQESHGVLDFADVLEPAIELARSGTPTSATVATQLRTAAHRMPTGQLPHLYPGGAALAEGAPLVQEELATTLEQLAQQGSDAFYRGPLAESLAAAVDGIDVGSLDAYQVQRSTPPSGTFAGYEVVAAAPPLPGAALIQMLQVAEALGIEGRPPDSADFIHTLAMAWRLADQSVAWELGDPDFVDVPVDRLTDPARNAELAAQVPMDGLLPIDPGTPPDGVGNTTSLSVVDVDGMAVSMTNTLTNFWGSGQSHAGFFVNDHLSRYSIGQGEANQPEAGRRPVSWTLPVVVLDEEARPVLAAGSPGGRRIPNILAQLLTRWAVHGQSLEEAVGANRFHLEGAGLEVEVLPGDDVTADLRARGYSGPTIPEPPFYFGSVQALEIDYESDEIIGARDARREADFEVRRP